MSRWAVSYGEVMDALTAHIAEGKGYDKMGFAWPSNWRELAEEEIDAMTNVDLIMLLWNAGILKGPES